MSAIPGEHLCVKHRGNHSHYSKENGTICKLQAELDEAERLIIALNDHEGTEGWSASLRADLNVFLAKRKLGKSLTQLASSEWHKLPRHPKRKASKS